jgi:curved DNA-binding protein CbpA
VVSDKKPPSHYDALGIAPGASGPEIERAYRLSLDLYREDALATYSLLDPEETRAARARIEEAYRVLRDPHGRWDYDDSLRPVDPPSDGQLSLPLPARSRQPAHAGNEVLPPPVTGAALKKFREGRDVTLDEIAARSKVSRRFLEYIEQDRYKDLPARVYLRGFLQEYARAVGLDPQHTADAYISLLPKSWLSS